MISDIANVKEAISNHVVVAASKLRSQSSLCNSICIFIQTNRFHRQEPQYKTAQEILFSEPTQNTFELLKASDKALKLMYKPKFRYHKAGVILSQLIVKTGNKIIGIKAEEQFSIQTDLFSSTFINNKQQYRRDKFIDVIDELKSKLGK
mgnify:FL=1